MIITSEDYERNIDETKTKSNAEILADTYFEYHGKHDDGNSPADAFEMKGVVIA